MFCVIKNSDIAFLNDWIIFHCMDIHGVLNFFGNISDTEMIICIKLLSDFWIGSEVLTLNNKTEVIFNQTNGLIWE